MKQEELGRMTTQWAKILVWGRKDILWKNTDNKSALIVQFPQFKFNTSLWLSLYLVLPVLAIVREKETERCCNPRYMSSKVIGMMCKAWCLWIGEGYGATPYMTQPNIWIKLNTWNMWRYKTLVRWAFPWITCCMVALAW